MFLAGGLAAVPAPAAAQDGCAWSGTAELPDHRPWQLSRLNPDSVWQLTRGAGVTVAVIDSGVSASHPLLAGKVRAGRDFGLPDHSGQCDLDGHGTTIAGIIAGRELPGVTIPGIAPDATILPARILTGRQERLPGDELPDRVAAAIEWAVDQGADVINLSLHTHATSRLDAAVDHAAARDVVMVAAAGNVDVETGVSALGYPAGYDQVIAVAGVRSDGTHVETSQAAGYVDVAAPGADILGPAPGDGYLAWPDGGTSYAAGYVSGVAALVRGYHRGLPAAEVAQRIIRTADRPPEGRNDQVGTGVVNPYRAVTTVLGTRTDPPPAPLALPPPAADRLATARQVALWTGLAGAGLAGVLLALPPLIRRVRDHAPTPGSDRPRAS